MIIESTEKERMIKVMTKEMAIHNLYALKQRTRALSNHEALDMAIKALDQTSWIPVSELPKKSGEYLLDSEDFGIFVGDYDADMKGFGWWREDYEDDPDTILCIDREFIEFEGILAWRELPQPYRAESEDKE